MRVAGVLAVAGAAVLAGAGVAAAAGGVWLVALFACVAASPLVLVGVVLLRVPGRREG